MSEVNELTNVKPSLARSQSSSSSSTEDGDDSIDNECPPATLSKRRDTDALLLPPDILSSAVQYRLQPRVLLWAVPRSISTAFFRAIMEGARIKVLLEPFSNAYYFGEERLSARYADRPATASCRFEDIRQLYEQPYSRYRSVFSKDMAYYLTAGDAKAQTAAFSKLLPRGYVHTFLIRRPQASVASLYRLSIDKQRTGWDWFNAAEAGFKELHDLFIYVTQRLRQPAIVVDADDLIHNPSLYSHNLGQIGVESNILWKFQQSLSLPVKLRFRLYLLHIGQTLIRYCQLTGLEFSDKMLSWKSIDYTLMAPSDGYGSAPTEITGISHEEPPTLPEQPPVGIEAVAEKQMSQAPQIFRGWGPWFEGVLSSTSFRAFSIPAPADHSSQSSALTGQEAKSHPTSHKALPPKVIQCIEECMPYYEYLRRFKL